MEELRASVVAPGGAAYVTRDAGNSQECIKSGYTKTTDSTDH